MKQSYTQIEGKFYQECQVIILPTKDITKIGINPERLSDNKLYYFDMGAVASDCQHLYFISDEEIKEGDWVLRGNGSYGCRKVLRITKDFAVCTDFWDKPIETPFPLSELKKIIATTDKLLTCNGVKREGESCTYNNNCKFPKCQLPRPSNEFLQAFVREWDKGNKITRVLVEMEEYAYEPIIGKFPNYEANPNPRLYRLKVADDNTISCKRVEKEEKIYTKSQIQPLLDDIDNFLGLFDTPVGRHSCNKYQLEAIDIAKKNRQIFLK